MARLVVYGSSAPCPDMASFGWWLRRHHVEGLVMLDVHRDQAAMSTLLDLVGSASVPTLVIASDDGSEPIEEPAPLRGGRVRALDRGTVLSEPNPGQIAEFLDRHGIDVTQRREDGAGSGLGRLIGRLIGG